MIVDASYMAWVRPTRRVHLALAVGMTVTGVILIATGLPGGRDAARPSPVFGRTADSVVSVPVGQVGPAGPIDRPTGPVPAAPLVPFAPALIVDAPPTPKATPAPAPTAHPKPKPKPKPHVQHATPARPPKR